MTIKMIEEEYWTIQYLTTVAGVRGKTWWPENGEGNYSTPEAAELAIRDDPRSRGDHGTRSYTEYEQCRVVKVIRRMEYGEPIKPGTPKTVRTVWACAEPPAKASYHVLRDEWQEIDTEHVRTIHEIRLVSE